MITVTLSPIGGNIIIDTHCHLDLPHFDADREAVLARAAAAGVGAIINPAIDLYSCRRVLALAERYPNVYAAVGVHPNDCADFDDATIVALRELARHPKVVAIGETGLDYYWNKVPHDQQKRALRAQLALAAELRLPVILHSRKSSSEERKPQGGESRQCHADLLWELERWWAAARTGCRDSAILDTGTALGQPRLEIGLTGLSTERLAGVWHAFSGDPSASSGQALAEAQAAYDLGLALGLGGPVTFQNARRLHTLVPHLRPDRLLLETDAPYLAPHPHRGQRNEPAYLPLIADALAGLLGTTTEALVAQTTATARTCFGKIA
jgi:TatD DNase family protein